ncbi:Tripartite tricarboxylate transporter family receptor [Pigmentiphaga humi]|uniref:Tripartite tricarboxylate transporter family receptor n=1 Tax=Pigmentiphaga humi TaxID=2478468 RepID=A0A3P4B460_9BURK|nr:tripartite tricarboxylate transporter substrate-binding protein [Pigmentiphaga humi]VCU71087.1 Tripartite tricarboxylate transporter family receptor [Pigmentiphaga humi]
MNVLKTMFAVCLMMLAPQLHAQSWPTRPVRVIVPFAAGGNTDSIARLTAERLSKIFNQQFIVENRAGAGGAIAAETVARAEPDGYTLFLSSITQVSVLPFLQKVSYDSVKDFAPVSIIGSNGLILGISASLPVSTFPELIEYIRKQPTRFPYATAGVGALSHLAVVELARRAKLEVQDVNYKGGALAMADVLSGQVPLYFGNLSDYMGHAGNPRLKLLATSSSRRTPKFPELPTVAEAGYPGYEVVTWNGLLAPAHTPAPIIDRLAREIQALTREPEFIAGLDKLGVDPVGNTPAQFAETIRADMKLYQTLLQPAGN